MDEIMEAAARAREAYLAPIDFLALRHMIRAGYAFSPGEISRVVACSRSNATKIVERLESAGYVRVTIDVFAPKLKSVSVTQAGHDAYVRAHHRFEAVDRFARLSEPDRRELYRLLGLFGLSGPRSRDATRVG